MSEQHCIHCGEKIAFFKVPEGTAISGDHPYRQEYETFGGWWVHDSGPAKYLRICAFGETLKAAMDAYAKLRDAKATPPRLAASPETIAEHMAMRNRGEV
jgi:hypothetical protein